MITTATKIKRIENNLEYLNIVEVNLESILIEDFEKSLANDMLNSI